MDGVNSDPLERPAPLAHLDEEAVLRRILEGTATATGERFFQSLVRNLSEALDTHAAWVTEYIPEKRSLRALAFWLGGEWVHDYERVIDGSPCEVVIAEDRLVHYPDRIVDLFPDDTDVQELQSVSYMGVPLKDLSGTILGHLAIMDLRPMPEEPRGLALFQIFAARAAAELQRLRAERQVREREEQLGRLVDSAMDGIIKLDHDFRVVLMNRAAEQTFQCSPGDAVGQTFAQYLSADALHKLNALRDTLNAQPEGRRSQWIPGGLRARCATGEEFPAEATLSQFELGTARFYTLILRNVNERVEAEQKIQTLTQETKYLQEELRALLNVDDIVGRSDALLDVLNDVRQVADTDSTVLILGETGTGKELIARAIHAASRRRDQPFVKVNCAAIPSTLIESEFFGHEKGAFTGATAKRDGRFALADRGTIFLDEIGELPIELQGKLLRVLQEGEFEPVGSSKTRRVNVRVLAATNRDLQQQVRNGAFREDLFYRLNVFPIQLPPLRDRDDDVVLLAASFAQKFAARMGKAIESPAPTCVERLKAYRWPGNVRELANVIERAVITSQDGRLNLDRALPDVGPTPSDGATADAEGDRQPGRIRTAKEMMALERKNILSALETSGWRVSGENGAASLLGINPSTLTSRMKTLGISRPRGR